MDKAVKQARLHSKYRESTGFRKSGRNLPWLNLTGVWLERAGFPVGQRIEIKIEEGQLIIKAV